MSDPYLGEIRLMSFNFAPRGWTQCNGQTLPINQNQALFSLLGTMYGGNGQTTFQLPNLQGRVPMHVGNSHVQGETAGEANHTLLVTEMPTHVHQINGSSANGTAPVPVTNVLAVTPTQLYAGANNLVAMNAATVANNGGSQAHNNLQPYLV